MLVFNPILNGSDLSGFKGDFHIQAGEYFFEGASTLIHRRSKEWSSANLVDEAGRSVPERVP